MHVLIMTFPIVLTIAGSDSSGGAGIQADLKTFYALQSYGCSVVTAITAQNTLGVQQAKYLSPEIIKEQCNSVFSDLQVQAIKTGMLGNKEIIKTVTNALNALPCCPPVIVDPVMVSTSGYKLLDNDAVECLVNTLFPISCLITPNLEEAAVLLNCPPPDNIKSMRSMLEDLLALGSKAVLLKGGHLKNDQCTDLFFDGHEILSISTPHVATKNTHGTGCSLASAITAFHARGYTLKDSFIKAKQFVYQAIKHSDQLNVGKGNGPIHHFLGVLR